MHVEFQFGWESSPPVKMRVSHIVTENFIFKVASVLGE